MACIVPGRREVMSLGDVVTTCLLQVFGDLIYTVSPDTVLRAWNILDGELNWESKAHKGAITGMQMREMHEVETVTSPPPRKHAFPSRGMMWEACVWACVWIS